MKKTKTRKISRHQYLMALGLFQLGFKHQEKATECEKELNAMLGCKEYSHLSDAIWGTRDFHEALKLEGLEIRPTKEQGHDR